MAAVTAADPEHGDQLLLEMLSEEQYERVVAETLVRRARKNEGPTNVREQSTGFRKGLGSARRQGTEEFVEERRSRYADAIRALVESFLRGTSKTTVQST